MQLILLRGGTLEGVKSLHVDALELENRATLSLLLPSTPNLTDLSFYNGRVDAQDLAGLRWLRRLELIFVGFQGPLPSSILCISRLRELKMLGACFVPAGFLSPSFLPELRYLTIDSSSPYPIDLLIPQLKAIELGALNSLPSVLLAKSLLLLTITDYDPTQRARLPHFPSLPPFISINIDARFTDDSQQDTTFVLEDIMARTELGVRRIFLHEGGINSTTELVIKRLESRGVRFEREKEGLDFGGAVCRMEEIMAEEKRAAEEAGVRTR